MFLFNLDYTKHFWMSKNLLPVQNYVCWEDSGKKPNKHFFKQIYNTVLLILCTLQIFNKYMIFFKQSIRYVEGIANTDQNYFQIPRSMI